MGNRQDNKNLDNIERLKRALTRILAIYYSGSSDGNPWSAFCQYLDDFETKHDCPRLWVVEETSKDGEKRCVLGEGLLRANDGPLAELSGDEKNFPILKINENAYKVIWSCFEKHPSCDNCNFFNEFIKLLQNVCFDAIEIKNQKLEELRECFTKLFDEEIQESIEEDQTRDAHPSDNKAIPGNLRDDFFDQLRKEFSGEFGALGLGPNARSTWDGDKSRVVFQIYNPFYRAFFYRNIIYLTRNDIQKEIKKRLKKCIDDNIEDTTIFEKVPEPLWMLSEIPKAHKHYLIGLAYHSRQMIFNAITDDDEKADGLLGKIGDLESVLALFKAPRIPSRLHVMPLYCYGQPRGVCAIIQAADTDQDSRVEHDGRAHQLQKVLSARISQRIEEEYEREYWDKILGNINKGRNSFIFECLRYSPYLLNVVAAAIYEEGNENPLTLFGFRKSFPSPNSNTELPYLQKNVNDYKFDELNEKDETYQKIKNLFNEKRILCPGSSDNAREPLNGFAVRGYIDLIDFEQEENKDLVQDLRMTKGTLLIKDYQENGSSYRLCFIVDCPIHAMRFHAKAIDDKFNSLKELYNAFFTKIEQKKNEEKIQELSRLEGVEPKLKDIINTVSNLRDQALEVQSKLFPGRKGLLNYRSDLALLFRSTGKLFFWVEKKGSIFNDYVSLKDLITSAERSDIQIRVSDSAPSTTMDIKIFEAEPSHNEFGESFRTTWEELYVPFLYFYGERKQIPILQKITDVSQTHEGIEGRLLGFLKEIIHRPYNPRFDMAPNNGIISLGLLLSTAFEASLMRKSQATMNVALTIIRSAELQETININSVIAILNLYDLDELDKKDALYSDDPEKTIWKSGAILSQFIPADFLSPLYQLLAAELSSKGQDGEQLCFAEKLELIAYLNSKANLTACSLNIKCENALYMEYLREKTQADESGLSSCLFSLAKCLNQAKPYFIDLKPPYPPEQKALPFRIYNWIEDNNHRSQITFTFPCIGMERR